MTRTGKLEWPVRQNWNATCAHSNWNITTYKLRRMLACKKVACHVRPGTFSRVQSSGGENGTQCCCWTWKGMRTMTKDVLANDETDGHQICSAPVLQHISTRCVGSTSLFFALLSSSSSLLVLALTMSSSRSFVDELFDTPFFLLLLLFYCYH